MKRPVIKTARPSRTRGTTEAAPVSTRLAPDPIKDDRMRRWAAKIASELPSGIDDALIVLKYAERLVGWAAFDNPLAPSTKRGRSAR